jgi:tetratricopeptide (TPR) repeat protein
MTPFRELPPASVVSPPILLPARPQAGPVDARAARRWDWTLVLLVCALAFLLASFPARNNDLWMRLASGRQLVHAVVSFTTPRVFADQPISPTWLYDLLGYGLYEVVAGPGLVLIKALLVAGTALVLLRLSWAGRDWWVPAACTALTLLAMSPRLLLQPATVSYLFLALTLWFLRPRRSTAAARSGEPSRTEGAARLAAPTWPLIPLFVLWVNVDRWFVLGLAVVLLVSLGEALDAIGKGQLTLSSVLRPLVAVLCLAAACLLNPAHVHAFALPPELATHRPPAPALLASLAGVACLLFLGLGGLLCFGLNGRGWSWRRFLPWLGLAVLGACQAHALPFFAVVAGPVLAWNVQELLARCADAGRPEARAVAEVGRAVAVVVGLVLVVGAWPGWLQSGPFEPRRWDVEPSPSLVLGAAATIRWHQEGKLGPDARGLHLSPESAQAFAWFCPEEPGVVNEPLASAVRGDPAAPADWAGRMRAAGIDHVFVHDADRGRLFAVLDGLLADPEEWVPLYVEGDLAVFGWRDPLAAGPKHEDPFRGLELDPNRLAFAHLTEDRCAPRQPPEQEPEVRHWWEAFWKPAPPRSIDRDEALCHAFHAEALRRSAPPRHLAAWESSQSAALVGAAGGWAGPASLLSARLRLTLLRPRVPGPAAGTDTLPALDRATLWLQEAFTRGRDDVPPGLLHLAVRAARRALAANPRDPQVQLLLGESYLRLLHSTRERAWGAQMPELTQLRRAQAAAAFHRALDLKPDYAQAHLSLGGLYREMGYLDLAQKHLDTYLRLAEKAGPAPGTDPRQFRDDAAALREKLDGLAREVQAREDAYEVAARDVPVLERAVQASRRGLAGKALQVLLDSDVSAFGPRGVALELELLLQTGRAGEVRDWAGPEQETALGPVNYHWLRAQALASSGNYALAEEECAQMRKALSSDPKTGRPVRFRQLMSLLVGQAVLDEHPREASVPYLFERTYGRMGFHQRVTGFARALRQEADVTVLRGLLALEEGRVDDDDGAAVAFRTALALYQNEAAAASGAGLEFNGRPVAEGYLELLVP